MDEVELKLRLPPAEAPRLRRSPLLRGIGGRPVTRHLRSVYYDTPDHALRRHDMALRVRDDGRRRVQTLKVPSGPSNGLHVYREIECRVEGPWPDLSRIDDEGLQAFFAANGVPGALVPVFEAAVERVLRHVRLGDSAIEVAIDVGCLRAGGGERPICEAELELRHGRPARLFELALDLQDEAPVAIEPRTKAARGYALAAREEAGWVKARPVPLEGDLGAAEAFALIAHGCLDQIRDNHPGVVEARDPEAVHQMRIGVRRMRALLGAFRPYIARPALDFMVAELRWLQRALGPARDWHVFAQEMVEPACRRLPLEPGLRRLVELARRMEERAMEEGCQALETARFTTLLLRFGLMLHDEGWIAPGAA
ncbi:MAG: CYTH and CHAD domain-containing protein, partial [Rhodospirillaceae bacterium]|nr:CYTH and CHAD domain-containing protein [Rhodospirillaceae bacterium]